MDIQNSGAGTGTPDNDPVINETSPNELILVPLREAVLFPGMVVPLAAERPEPLAGLQEAARQGRPVAVVLQRDPAARGTELEELYPIGVEARLLRYVTSPDGKNHTAIVQGTGRVRLLERTGTDPLTVRVERLAEPAGGAGPELDARMHQLREQALEALRLIGQVPQELLASVQSIDQPGVLADMVAGLLDLPLAQKQEILETLDIRARLDRVLWQLAYRLQVLRLSADIGRQTRETMEGRQREFMLREQLKTIQKELGEGDERGPELDDLRAALDKAKLPEEVEKQARRELRRLERMPEGSPESGMVRTYLEWLSELPWQLGDAPEISIPEARKILDDEHFGLEKVKRRILEFLAVRRRNPEGRGPILCFVGPPGVGKTSLGQSIAHTLGRPFVRVSLGGVHDEAEIRGHRRTYIGALPGNIIQGIRRAGARDCVMMLDEIDKLGGGGFQGDPASAMLEVLDPEQNGTFRDAYLGVPFDLSRVLFIATANQLDTIPGPLRDRMEIVALSGYTAEEKEAIARRYLLPRQLKQNGIGEAEVALDPDVLPAVIEDYTREAGVRSLEREIGGVMRHAAVRLAEDATPPLRIHRADLPAILGPARFDPEVAGRAPLPGVVTGLAWTPVGGDILFIEASRMPGSGRLILTGQLGDVMKESAQAALSLVKGRAEAMGIDPSLFEKRDIHVHVPAGATPKDGPSAGVAMFLALSSLMLGRAVDPAIAMTGEISLRGLVLPVGGIREKVVAAARAGITTVMLPARNRRDFDDIPASAREKLRFVWLETVEDALAAALPGVEARELEAVG
ncbi:endopeptidase La [Roseomonas sp. OT10]|uniref:endopeptidase La n=1 Tax=Roseomonas cutis TaxID=2897332 RepID=UPI001E49CA6B|nr:endopeptidase La [Roseomonas sp. OT10]UFN47424.1 endopeptidase La [Roseomonas sp. OT10]